MVLLDCGLGKPMSLCSLWDLCFVGTVCEGFAGQHKTHARKEERSTPCHDLAGAESEQALRLALNAHVPSNKRCFSLFRSHPSEWRLICIVYALFTPYAQDIAAALQVYNVRIVKPENLGAVSNGAAGGGAGGGAA